MESSLQEIHSWWCSPTWVPLCLVLIVRKLIIACINLETMNSIFSPVSLFHQSCRYLVSFKLLTSHFNWNYLNSKVLGKLRSINMFAYVLTAQIYSHSFLKKSAKMKDAVIGLTVWRIKFFGAKNWGLIGLFEYLGLWRKKKIGWRKKSNQEEGNKWGTLSVLGVHLVFLLTRSH